MIGEVRIRGVRLCEPCNYLAKQTSPEVLKGLVHKGGLRAQILSEGYVRPGDALVEVVPNKSLQPTATAVTPPAAQEIVPAVAVTEH
jgi:MOSC domain-containing protein YiiM